MMVSFNNITRLFVGWLFLVLSGCNSENQNQKPNLIFILVDDLGKEWIPSYGATEIETPNIDKLAANGIKFNKAYSMPQCTPSRIALMTGQYPYTSGWVNHYDVPRWGHGANFDAQKNPGFAKVLREAGYKTCVAGKWQVNDFRIEPDAMTKAGFDEYCMWTGYESNNPPSEKRYWDPYIHTKKGSKTYTGQFGPDVFSDFIIDFLRENKANPMCVYYPMVLTHTPFVHTPLEPNAKTFYEKHLAMVRYTDFIIGKIVDALEELQISDNTYLIFTTDNGTTNKIIGKRDSVYVRGGKAFLTENGVNAPLIAVTPKKLKKESNALVDFTDFYPTLLDLANIENNSGFITDGVSFADVLTDRTYEGSRNWALAMGGLPAVITEDSLVQNRFEFRDRVIRTPKYKAYVDTVKQVVRLFDMEKDPYETTNLIDQEELESVVGQFNEILKDIPSVDNNPTYRRLESNGSDVSIEMLQNGAKRTRKRGNMLPLSNHEAFKKMKENRK
ncbi:sulfatase-like hydrolase/transferase [Saccharicrinis sp. 156]|uniref:sulfatase-like hydrolase/transferase n=1 Tax=Saccharicrinis sp. 156 TaxID=3417574 RepID=UPI003D35308A